MPDGGARAAGRGRGRTHAGRAGVPRRRDAWWAGFRDLQVVASDLRGIALVRVEQDADLRCGAGAPEAEVNALPQGLVGPFGGDALDLSLVRFRPVHEVDVEGDHVALRGGAVLDPPCLHVVEARTGKRDAARTDPAERRRMGRPADEAALLAPRRRGRPRVQETARAGNEIATSQHGKSLDADAGLLKLQENTAVGKFFESAPRRPERNSGGVRGSRSPHDGARPRWRRRPRSAISRP